MANVVEIPVEDVNTVMDTYTSLQLERASTVDGAYALITTIALVEDTYNYEYDDASGTSTSWYRYRYYNATGPVASDFSNPFQAGGITRKRLRQKTLEEYECGLVVLQHSAGGDANTFSSTDYRVAQSLYATDRGKGTWLYPTTGVRVGQTRRVIATDPDANAAYGTMDVYPAWAGVLGTGDEVEWHWLADPITWNRSINNALRRYTLLERYPVTGASGNINPEQELAAPGLDSRQQIRGLWYTAFDNSVERPYGSGTNWWKVRADGGRLYLHTSRALTDTDLLYLEYLRPVPPVHTDESLLPEGVNLDLAAALVYDEVLRALTLPMAPTAPTDKGQFLAARKLHQPRLRSLWHDHGPRPRSTPPMLGQPTTFQRPVTAR